MWLTDDDSIGEFVEGVLVHYAFFDQVVCGVVGPILDDFPRLGTTDSREGRELVFCGGIDIYGVICRGCRGL